MSSIKDKTFRNLSYLGLAQISVLALTFFMIAVLARLLTPEDFGIASIGMILIALFTTVQDFGITQAIVQRDSRVEDSIAVGLSIRWIIAAAMLVVIIILSHPISEFYNEDAIASVFIVMSVNLFVQPIAFSSRVMLSRRLEFRRLAVGNVVQYGAMAMLSVCLALMGLRYWSLVYGSIAGSIAYVVTLRYYERVKVRPMMDKALAGELMGFGTHLFVAGLMAYVIFNIDQLVIGKVLGVAVLGFYFMAVRFGRTLGDQISVTVNRVLFPTMARMKSSVVNLREGYKESLRMVSIITVPLSVGMAALAPMVVVVVLGSDWSAASFPIAVFSVQGLLNALIQTTASSLMAIGKPKYLSVQSSVQAGIMVVTVYPVARHYGIDGVCVLSTVLSLGVFICFIFIFSRVFESSPAAIVKPMASAAASGAVTFAFLASAVHFLPPSLPLLVVLLVAGAALYLGCLHVSSGGKDTNDLRSLVKGLVSNS